MGWQTTDMPTDLILCHQMVGQPEMRVVSGSSPTALHFPSPARQDWPLELSVAELRKRRLSITRPDGFLAAVLDDLARQRVFCEAESQQTTQGSSR